MSKNRRKPRPNNQVNAFQKECRSIFSYLYRATNQPYVLIAHDRPEWMVSQGKVTIQEALLNLRNPSAFAQYLSDIEKEYSDRKSQRLHERMLGVERNTDWLPMSKD